MNPRGGGPTGLAGRRPTGLGDPGSIGDLIFWVISLVNYLY